MTLKPPPDVLYLIRARIDSGKAKGAPQLRKDVQVMKKAAEEIDRQRLEIERLRRELDDAPAGGQASDAPSMLGEVWMAFGEHEGTLVALPEYAAVSERAVKQKILESAHREGFTGTVDERLKALGWTICRMSLASGVPGTDCTEPNRAACPRKCIEFCNKAEQAAAEARGDDAELMRALGVGGNDAPR